MMCSCGDFGCRHYGPQRPRRCLNEQGNHRGFRGFPDAMTCEVWRSPGTCFCLNSPVPPSGRSDESNQHAKARARCTARMTRTGSIRPRVLLHRRRECSANRSAISTSSEKESDWQNVWRFSPCAAVPPGAAPQPRDGRFRQTCCKTPARAAPWFPPPCAAEWAAHSGDPYARRCLPG